MIYFLRDPDTGRIKIGTSSRLARRLKELSAEFGDGLVVLAIADGSFDVEYRLHQKFAHLRVAGEWFAPGDDLLDFIATEGKPWDDSCGEKDDVTVKLDRLIVSRAKFVAAARGIPVAEYLSELVRTPVARDFVREGKRLASEGEEGGKPPPP